MHLHLRLEVGAVYLELGRMVEDEPEEAAGAGIIDTCQHPSTVYAPRLGYRLLSDGGEIAEDV